MGDYLIVDGYNIINCWPELVAIKQSNYAHARDKLVDMLSDYSGLVGEQIIVVFDAQYVKGGVQRHDSVPGVEIIYTREGETADSLIERLVGELPPESSIGVATSDWAEQTIIFGKGAYRLTAMELRQRIREVKLALEQHAGAGNQPFRLDSRLGSQLKEILEKWRRRRD